MLKRKIDRFSRSLFAKDILQQLRIGIISGELKSKHRLVESQLAEEFGVSRGPVRSALHALEQQGLVQSLPSGGAEVVGFSEKHALDLFTIRQNLEELASRLIVERSDIDTSVLHDLTDRMEKETSIDRLHDLDMQFHLEYMRLADNWALLQLWLTLSPVISDMLTFTNSLFRNFELIAANHKILLKSIEDRDINLALNLINDHLKLPKRLVVEKFAELFNA